ncbi:MAG: YraN family protein [Vampirovibrionales bacterium]
MPPTPPSANQTLGQQGEAFAEAHLVNQGYTVLARRWRAGKLGELDRVLLSPCLRYVVGLEVKTRRPTSASTGVEVPASKVERLQRCLLALMQTLPSTHPTLAGLQPRCDWMLVTLPHGGLPQYQHFENIGL